MNSSHNYLSSTSRGKEFTNSMSGTSLPKHLGLIAVLLLVFAADAFAQGTTILSPATNATVRGTVRVQVQKADPDSGWVSFKLDGPGQKSEYVAAISKPYVFLWDTLQRKDGKALYPDGTYTISALACNPAGQSLGESSVTVTVNNAVSGFDAPTSVRLAMNYKRGREYTYKIEGQRDVSLRKSNPMLDPIVKELDTVLHAEYVDHAMTTSSGGPALIRKRAVQGWTQVGKEAKSIPGLGETYTISVQPTGSMGPKHKGDKNFDLGELTLELPNRDLRVGDTWTSKLWLMLDPTATKRHEVKAQHRLDGFQWYNGLKVARIVSTFSEKGTKFTIRFKNGSASLETDYKGTRYSYFAWEEGRFVAIEDSLNHNYDIDVAQLSAALTGGGFGGGMPGAMGPDGMPMPGMDGGMMPGMPGAPGMPGMDPGMMPPGMPGAPGMPGMPSPDGGMMPGAPGMPGMGMPGMEGMPGMGYGMQMMPAKVKGTGTVTMTVTEQR